MCLEVHLTPNFFVSRRNSLLFQTTLVKKIYLGTMVWFTAAGSYEIGSESGLLRQHGKRFSHRETTERRRKSSSRIRTMGVFL